MNNKVSVIIPVYNAEKFLKYCLNSVINQTYNNLEIILINDGSIDNSLDVCNEYTKKYKNIKLFTQKNAGVSSARNLGIKKSSGEFLAFVDSDDYVNPYFIEKLVNLITKENVDLAASGIIKVPDYNYSKIYSEYNEKTTTANGAYNMMLTDVNFFGYSCNKLYKKKIIVDNKIFFDENIHICEDFEFNARYLQYANNITYCSEQLYYYFENVKSATNEYKYSERQASVLKAYENICKIYRNVNHELYDLTIFNFIKHKLNINYRLHLNKRKSNFVIMTEEERKIIKKSRNLSIIKKIYIFTSCKFPIITSKIKISIRKLRRKFI